MKIVRDVQRITGSRPPWVLAGLVLAALLLLAAGAIAGASSPLRRASAPGVPSVISFQGQLTDPSGAPLTGDYTMVFSIYDGPDSTAVLWSETQVVSVTDGLFHVYLGEVTPLGEAIFDGQDLYLGVSVGSDAEMSPRMRLASAPYAFTAQQSQCLLTTWYYDGDGDGYGTPTTSMEACGPPSGFVADGSDCDDGNPDVHPGATELCNGLDDNCDGTVDEGNPEGGGACVTTLPGVCAPGTETCLSGSLACIQNVYPSSELCDGQDNDCDGAVDEDFDLTSDPNNCGLCGWVCTDVPHATEGCVGGNCLLVSCDPSWGNCNGSYGDGCEASLNSDVNHCGACGVVCDLPHAVEACAGGSCSISSCESPWLNCNGAVADGCEVHLDSGGGGCTAAPYLGQHCGDDLGCRQVAQEAGVGEAWYRIRLQECDNNPVLTEDLELRAELVVPVGMDYDLYLYSPCGTLVDSSAGETTTTEIVYASVNDNLGEDESTDFFMEVRWSNGSSCQPWTLTVYADCTSSRQSPDQPGGGSDER